MREVHDDHARLWTNHTSSFAQIRTEGVFESESPMSQFAPDRPGNRVQLLVRRIEHDDLVAGLEQRVHNEVVRFTRTIRSHHALRIAVGPAVGNGTAQLRITERPAVMQHYAIEIIRCDVEELT